MRIIKSGDKGPRKVLKATCSHCNAEVEARKQELLNSSGVHYFEKTPQRDVPFFVTGCPECKNITGLAFYDYDE